MISNVELKIFFSQKVSMCPKSYDELQITILKVFNLQDNYGSDLEICYIDDENDHISVSNEFDLDQMISFAKNHGLILIKLTCNLKEKLNEKFKALKVNEVKPDIKKVDTGDHSIYQNLIMQLKSCPELKAIEDKHLLNALVLSNADISLAKERLSNKKLNFCEYYDKNKLI